MASDAALLTAKFEDGRLELAAGGSWTAPHAAELETLVDRADPQLEAAARERVHDAVDTRGQLFGEVLRFHRCAQQSAGRRGHAGLDQLPGSRLHRVRGPEIGVKTTRKIVITG